MPKYDVKKAFFGKQNKQFARKQLVPFLKKAARAGVRDIASAYAPEATPFIDQIMGNGGYNIGVRKQEHRRFTAGTNVGGKDIRRPHHGASHPHMSTSQEDHKSIIRHSEYLGDLVSNATSGGFIAQNYAINAANGGTFPWLSDTAINYQNYRFHKLVYEYRPLVSNATSSSTGALVSMGKVILSVQYDSVLGAYTSSQTAENSEGAVSVKPSESALIGIECKSALNPLGVYYTSGQNSLTVGANASDIRMQNMGILCVVAAGVPTTGTPIDLGEIWVHYEVELLKPQLNAGLSNVLSSHYQINGATSTYSLGTSQTATANNYLPLIFTFPATCNGFQFPLQITQGSFMMVWVCNGTSVLSGDGPACSVVNGTLLTCFFGDTVSSAQIPSVGALETATRTALVAIISVNAPGSALCAVTFVPGTIPTGATCDLFVTPYNTSMLL